MATQEDSGFQSFKKEAIVAVAQLSKSFIKCSSY